MSYIFQNFQMANRGGCLITVPHRGKNPKNCSRPPPRLFYPEEADNNVLFTKLHTRLLTALGRVLVGEGCKNKVTLVEAIPFNTHDDRPEVCTL